jgi:hypothetical protein
VLRQLREPAVKLIRLVDFERSNPDLLAIKGTRCMRDYYFTLSSCVVTSALQHAQPNEVVTYVDADLFFYTSPTPIYEAMANASVALIGHRFHWWTKRLEKYGRFNVGWVSFRSDAIGAKAAQWWRNSCLEWCYGCVDEDRFADQKYLEHIFHRFSNVVEVAHPGTNLGPWNICRHSITQGPENAIVVDTKFPLIFFHFSGLKEAEPDVFLCSRISYLGPFSETVRKLIYEPYIVLLKQIQKEIGGIRADATPKLAEDVDPSLMQRLLAPMVRTIAKWAGHYVSVGRGA